MQFSLFEDTDSIERFLNQIPDIPGETSSYLCNQPFWHMAAWKAYRRGIPGCVAAITEDQTPRALLLLLTAKARFAGLPVNKMEPPENRIFLSTPIGEEEALNFLFEQIAHTGNLLSAGSDVIHLTVSEQQYYLLQRSGLPENFWLLHRPKKSLLLECEDNEEFITRVLSSNRRKHFRRITRKIDSEPEFEKDFFCAGELPEQFDELWADFLSLYQDSWKVRSRRTILGNQADHQFWRLVLHQCRDREILHYSRLKRFGRTVAGLWWIQTGHTLYPVLNAHDQALSDYHPGLYLIYSDVITFLNRGRTCFDFMGEQPYKKAFTNREICYRDVYLIKKSFYGRVLKTAAHFSPLFRKEPQDEKKEQSTG